MASSQENYTQDDAFTIFGIKRNLKLSKLLGSVYLIIFHNPSSLWVYFEVVFYTIKFLRHDSRTAKLQCRLFQVQALLQSLEKYPLRLLQVLFLFCQQKSLRRNLLRYLHSLLDIVRGHYLYCPAASVCLRSRQYSAKVRLFPWQLFNGTSYFGKIPSHDICCHSKEPFSVADLSSVLQTSMSTSE